MRRRESDLEGRRRLATKSVSRETSRNGRKKSPLEPVVEEYRRLGLRWDSAAQAKWESYFQLFEDWARRVNLVSRRDRGDWVARHVVPSLRLLSVVDLRRGMTVADVGSGGGFPGLPLAIVKSECGFYLVESKRWRALFLEEARETLGLENVQVLGDRAESETVRRELAGACDVAVARAVADVSTLWTWCEPLLSPAGRLVVYKGRDEAEEELAALKKSGFGVTGAKVCPLPGFEGTVIVVVQRSEAYDGN